MTFPETTAWCQLAGEISGRAVFQALPVSARGIVGVWSGVQGHVRRHWRQGFFGGFQSVLSVFVLISAPIKEDNSWGNKDHALGVQGKRERETKYFKGVS